MEFRTAFPKEPLVGPVLSDFEPTLTQQQFAEECDINEILRRSAIAGGLAADPAADTRRYEDVSDYPVDFQTAQNLVIQATESFMELDAKVRERFHNDPGRWMEFMGSLSSDKGNFDEAIRLGLAVVRPDEAEIAAAELGREVDREIAKDEAKRSRLAKAEERK